MRAKDAGAAGIAAAEQGRSGSRTDGLRHVKVGESAAFARQAFNAAVMTYNNSAQQFPGNLVGNNFGFKPAEQLSSTESDEEKKAVKVQF